MKYFIAIIYFFLIPIITKAQWNHEEKADLQDKRQVEYLYNHQLYQACASACKPAYIQYLSEKSSDNTYVSTVDLVYYYIASNLKMKTQGIAYMIDDFVSNYHVPEYYINRISFMAGIYYFEQGEYDKCLPYLIRSQYEFLSEDELVQKKFDMGYCYFLQKDFENAYSEFSSIKNINNKYIYDANYYNGILAFGIGNYTDALESFSYIEKYPKYKYVVPYYIAEIYYHLNNLDNCIIYINKNIKSDSLQYKENLYALLAQAYFEKKNYAQAIIEFQKALSMNYTLSESQQYSLGYAYYTEENVDQAIEYLKPLSDRQDSVGQNAMYLLADCFLQKEDLNQAKNAFNYCKNLDFNPIITENSYFNYIKTCYALGQYHDALRSVDGFVTRYPNSKYLKEISSVAGEVFLNTNNFSQGWSMLAKDSTVDDPKIQSILQQLALGNGKESLNSNHLQRATTYFMYGLNHPITHAVTNECKLWLGETYGRLQNYELALKFSSDYLRGTNRSIHESDHVLIAKYNESFSQLQLGEANKAIEGFTDLSKNKNNSTLGIQMKSLSSVRLGDAYFMKNDYTKAKNYYSDIESQQSQDIYYIQWQKAKLMGLTANGSEQIMAFKKIATDSLNPYKYQAEYELSDLYFTSEKYTQAISGFTICIDKNVNPTASLYKLGLCQEQINKDDDAIVTYQSLVKNYPSAPEVKPALHQLENIYINRNDIKSFQQFTSTIGTNLYDQSKLDSLNYSAAENLYTNEKYPQSINAFKTYLSEFTNGIFQINARYYLSESYRRTNKNSEALDILNQTIVTNNSPFYDMIKLSQASLLRSVSHDTLGSWNIYKEILTNSTNSITLNNSYNTLAQDYFIKEPSSLTDLINTYLIASQNTVIENSNDYLTLWRGMNFINDKKYDAAQSHFQTLINAKKSPFVDEAIYYNGLSLLLSGKVPEAEQAMLKAVSYNYVSEYWNLKYYLLLSDIFIAENDNFNAKATLKSLIENSNNTAIVQEAQRKLNAIK